jgi:hypothetical protein
LGDGQVDVLIDRLNLLDVIIRQVLEHLQLVVLMVLETLRAKVHSILQTLVHKDKLVFGAVVTDFILIDFARDVVHDLGAGNV